MAMSTSLMASVHSIGILHCRGNRQQHFAVRDPVIATDGAALIGSDGYLMSLRLDAVVVAVPSHVWDRLC
jgi:hypothetical protein